MKRDGTFARGWRRREAADPAQIMETLNGRVLNDLDTCRAVWEHAQNPLAVCEAIRQADLPEWVRSAALFLIVDGTQGDRRFAKTLWTDLHRDNLDKARAAHVAMLRAHPGADLTREQAWSGARTLTRERFGDAMPSTTLRGVQAAFSRVCTRLRDPWRYFTAPAPLRARIDTAYEDFLTLMKRNLKKTKAIKK